jgi:hypothetical protein
VGNCCCVGAGIQLWVGRWREDVIEDGRLKRVQKKEILGSKIDYPTKKLALRAQEQLSHAGARTTMGYRTWLENSNCGDFHDVLGNWISKSRGSRTGANPSSSDDDATVYGDNGSVNEAGLIGS